MDEPILTQRTQTENEEDEDKKPCPLRLLSQYGGLSQQVYIDFSVLKREDVDTLILNSQ